MTCCLVAPAGTCIEMNPAKTMLVPSPRIFGPSTDSVTDTTPRTRTVTSRAESTRSVPSSRLALGPKFCAFCPGAPPAIGPRGPGPRPRAAHEVASAASWDSTISR